MVRSERFESAGKGGFGPVAHGVIPKASGGDARRFGQIGNIGLALFVEAIEQHRDRAAEMRHDEFDVRIAVGDLLGDHVQYKSGVLERGADRRAIAVIDDKR